MGFTTETGIGDYGYVRHTLDSGYTVTVEAKDNSEPARVVLTMPGGLDVLSFEHHNPQGAGRELAAALANQAPSKGV